MGSNRRGRPWISAEWEAKAAALEAAFRALSADPPEFLIQGIGRQLMLMCPAPIQKKPMPTKRTLKKLAEAVAGLNKALIDISPETARAIKYKLSQLTMLRVELDALQASVNAAEPRATRGAPVKAQPRTIAEVVAVHYSAITDNKPTVRKKDGIPYGPFLELLKTVFNILEVKASPQSQAEAVSRGWNSSPKKILGIGYGNK